MSTSEAARMPQETEDELRRLARSSPEVLATALALRLALDKRDGPGQVFDTGRFEHMIVAGRHAIVTVELYPRVTN